MAYSLATYLERRRYQSARGAYQSAQLAVAHQHAPRESRLPQTRARYARIGRALAVAVAAEDAEQVAQSLAELPRRAQRRALETLGERFELGECEDCHSVTPTQALNSHGMCEECEQNYWNCSRCGNRTSDSPYIVDECECCDSCVEDAHRWESDGEMHWQEEEEEEEDGIPAYHTFRRKCHRICGEPVDGLPDVGIELEFLTDPEETESCAAAVTSATDLVCGVERDGSLDDGGAEIVTHFGALPVISEKLAAVCQTLRKFRARSHDSTCCGLHVSLSCNGASTYEIARYVVFWNCPENSAFLTKFARRWGEFYAQPKPQTKGRLPSPTDSVELAEVLADSDRRELVNLQERHRGRIEVRAFRGSTRLETVRACVELAALSFAYCRTPAPSLAWPHFLNWANNGALANYAKNMLTYYQNHQTTNQEG